MAEAPVPGGALLDIDQARAKARERFKQRVERGDPHGCECHDDMGSGYSDVDATDENARCVAGVRFVDSGRVYYFDVCEHQLEPGDWVVVETSRGSEAAKVVIAPHQVVSDQLEGNLRTIERKLTDADVERMDRLRKDSARAVRVFSARIREHHLPMKPVSADFSFDGSSVLLSFSSPDRVDFRKLVLDLSNEFNCKVELQQVGPRDEARLIGGVGRCGRTLCCSTWLPMFPEINMGMAKTQDLALSPAKVSGVCGRLLCCLSYENEQYRQMKSAMPRLGQKIETPNGFGTVISMQILADQVTVRLDERETELTFDAADLGFGYGPAKDSSSPAGSRQVQEAQQVPIDPDPVTAPDPLPEIAPRPNAAEAEKPKSKSKRRRRRRRRGGSRSSGPSS